MKISETVRHELLKCLSCGEEMDAATCVGNGGKVKPQPGDITVCIYCGHVMAFGDDLGYRPLNDEEIVEIAGDKRILAIQIARAAMKEKRSREH